MAGRKSNDVNFIDLQEAYRQGKEQTWAYRDSCMEVLKRVSLGYMEWLDAPRERLRFFAPSEKNPGDTGQKKSTIFGSLEWRKEDGFFWIGLAIDVTPDDWAAPIGELIYRLLVKKNGGQVLVRTKPGGENHLLNLDRDEDLERVFREMFDMGESALRRSVVDYVRSDEKKIGFDLSNRD